MKRYLKLGAISALFVLSVGAKAQDKHFSQFDAAPLYYNPALAGVYDGSHRFIGNYKGQWSVYETFMASYDRMLPKEVHLLGGYFGAGAMLNYDQAGVNSYGQTELNLMPAYHRPIVDNKLMMSIGASFKFNMYSIDESTIILPNTPVDENGNPIGGTDLENTSTMNADVSLGVNLHYVIVDKYPTNLGMTMFHIAETGNSFLDDAGIENPRRYAINTNSEIGLTTELKLLPSVIWTYQEPTYEVNMGSFARYDLTKLNKVVQGVYLGAWYRLGDAVIGGIAFDFPGFDVNHVFNFGVSYDFTASEFNESKNWGNTQGNSLEVSVKYIIKNAPFKFETPGIINEPVM